MTPAAARIVAELKLSPLPHEGGFFRVQWLSPQRDAAGRPAAGLIWFLITDTPDGFSALHRVDAPEEWEFHAGDAVEQVVLSTTTRTAEVTVLGGPAPGATATRRRGVLVPADAWQGARLRPAGDGPAGCGWALLSCTMRPAWIESGFALGERAALSRDFPAAADWIRALTR